MHHVFLFQHTKDAFDRGIGQAQLLGNIARRYLVIYLVIYLVNHRHITDILFIEGDKNFSLYDLNCSLH